MRVRLLGKEQEAKTAAYRHPFTDVPAWASSSVGYLYANGISKGVGTTMFGSSQLATPMQYASFVLRVLGYTDIKWNEAIFKGMSVGLFTVEEGTRLSNMKTLPRGVLALTTYNGLYTCRNGTGDSLLEILYCQNACISAAQVVIACEKDSRLAAFVQTGIDGEPGTPPANGTTASATSPAAAAQPVATTPAPDAGLLTVEAVAAKSSQVVL